MNPKCARALRNDEKEDCELKFVLCWDAHKEKWHCHEEPLKVFRGTAI